jgi:hypothetical protein
MPSKFLFSDRPVYWSFGSIDCTMVPLLVGIFAKLPGETRKLIGQLALACTSPSGLRAAKVGTVANASWS